MNVCRRILTVKIRNAHIRLLQVHQMGNFTVGRHHQRMLIISGKSLLQSTSISQVKLLSRPLQPAKTLHLLLFCFTVMMLHLLEFVTIQLEMCIYQRMMRQVLILTVIAICFPVRANPCFQVRANLP